MIYENMKNLEISSAQNVIKVGDTIADIKEGKNAGVKSIGILDGSSLMGLNEDDFEKLSEDDKNSIREKTKRKYLDAQADFVIKDLSELLELLGL